MIIDSHTHLMEEDFNYLPGMKLQDFINVLDSASVDVAVLFTLTGLIRDFKQHNDRLAEAIGRYPHRFVGLGSVNPWYGEEAQREVHRCFTELGFQGLKLHPWFTGFLINSAVMDPICEIAAEYRKPILFHTGTPPGSAPLQVGVLAQRHPDVTFVLAHLGLPDLWPEAIAVAERYRNIYVETCGAHSLSITTAVDRIGPHRVLYGSDAPFGGPKNILFQRDKLFMLDFPRDSIEMIMHGNAQRLFGIHREGSEE